MKSSKKAKHSAASKDHHSSQKNRDRSKSRKSGRSREKILSAATDRLLDTSEHVKSSERGANRLSSQRPSQLTDAYMVTNSDMTVTGRSEVPTYGNHTTSGNGNGSKQPTSNSFRGASPPRQDSQTESRALNYTERVEQLKQISDTSVDRA